MERDELDGEELFRLFNMAFDDGTRALERNSLARAEASFEEALTFSRFFARTKPRPDVLHTHATTLYALADTLRRLSANPEREPLLRESADMLRTLTRASPGDYEHELTTVLLELAKVYRDAEFYVGIGLPLMVELDEMRDYRRSKLADGTWSGLMPTATSVEWEARAEEPLIEAIPLLRNLCRRDRAQYEPRLALSLNLLGELYVTQDRLEAALPPLREAEALYRGLVRDDDGYSELLTDTLQWLVKATAPQDSSRERISAIEETLPALRNAANIDSEDRERGVTLAKAGARDRLRDALKELAELYKANGEPDRASQLWDGELGELMMESLRIRMG